jgi:hypothetical protein
MEDIKAIDDIVERDSNHNREAIKEDVYVKDAVFTNLEEATSNPNPCVIYVLLLEDNKYYIGRTTNLKDRIDSHMKGKGSAWTSMHKVIELYASHMGDAYDEDKFVLMYMSDFGITNVRGGVYSNPVLTLDQQVTIYKAINHANNWCMACGCNDHFINKCTTIICMRCGRPGHDVTRCYAKSHNLGGALNGCYRCGREDHWAVRCNRTYDIFGRKLDGRCSIM